jgi:hypothetical protein
VNPFLVTQTCVLLFFYIGVELAPQKLAMGQTYEQLDVGEEGRLGKSKYTYLYTS